MKNKLILVPAALLISAFLPWAIKPLLMLGGAYLCFEGFEKIAHRFLHPDGTHNTSEPNTHANTALQNENASSQHTQTQSATGIDVRGLEKEKVRGAIRTDFILSAEVIAITLGTVENAPLATQTAVLSAIAVIMTLGVYGLVAGIVKLDDLGLYLSLKGQNHAQSSTLSRIQCSIGRILLLAAPWLMKTLSVLGTAAMFLVGGGILTHALPFVHHVIEYWAVGPLKEIAETQSNTLVAMLAKVSASIAPPVLDGVVGIFTGALVLLIVTVVQKTVVNKSPSAVE
jgi:hypothetical protein